MEKKLDGTTLIYDVTGERYLRTEIYVSGDPSDTMELRIVGEQPDGPFMLEERHRKRTSTKALPDSSGKTLDGLPNVDRDQRMD